MTISSLIRYSFCILIVTLTSACAVTPKSRDTPTLADIDISSEVERERNNGADKKTQEEIRKAYRTYVENASTHDSSRQKALTRLAQLELELSNTLVKDSDTFQDQTQVTNRSLRRTTDLLETTLQDYPEAKGNDKVLYQLAQAYDRGGQYPKSIEALSTLVQKYPRSFHYPEAQFRLAENAFVRGDYLYAEDAYTEVLLSPSSEKFYEKSLFKRGWTRYKQQFYVEAIDDYIDAIKYHKFDEYDRLSNTDKTQFDEYFRALGLAFSYQRGQLSIEEYFAQRSDFAYLYETYAIVSDIYLQQKRFSDAATVLEEYTQSRRLSQNTPLAEQKIIAAWQLGGFSTRLYAAIERFYLNYQPNSHFWSQIKDPSTVKTSQDILRTYITQVSSHFHKRYQKKNKTNDYRQANIWYERYLKHYSSYANQDNIYALYGELLLHRKQYDSAIHYFSQAAYDGDIILDKKAAYSTIVLSATLIDSSKGLASKNKWLNTHLIYAQRYVDLYSEDSRSEVIATSAAERAYGAKLYNKTIELANFISDKANEETRFNANNLKARSYLELQKFADAEAVYMELLDSKLANRKKIDTISDSLALAIYRQGEFAKSAGQTDIALSHFIRITDIVPKSELAATGLYDAIAISMEAKNWKQAIDLIEEFKAGHPRHKATAEVSKKLSVAYLNSDQKGKAAQEFEQIARIEANIEVKKAALWQAAVLYESKNNSEAAIRAYREFAHTYKAPYEQNMEAMYKLAELYKKARNTHKRYFWQTHIRLADQKATRRVKTERTTYIASTTTLDLARQKEAEFSRVKLIDPIAKNLQLKKAAMQESVKLFGYASSYGIEEITSEATHSIGDIYFDFSKSLLSSERPKNLDSEELEQYEILLEDQAFPFEEKAIEFYETNMARTREGTFNESLQKSFGQLLKLFPVRYKRKGKIDVFQQ